MPLSQKIAVLKDPDSSWFDTPDLQEAKALLDALA